MNETTHKYHWLYLTGFFIILALPILTLPPWFYPPDFGKTIIFRSVLAILLFLFIFQLLYKKNEIKLPNIKKSKIIWALIALFAVFLLASIFSIDPYFSLWGSPYRGGGFVTFAFYFIFVILAFILFKKRDWKRAWDFSIIIGILVSLIAIIQYYGLFDRIFLPAPGRPPSTMGSPIILALYLLLLSFLTFSFAIKEKKYLKKFFYFSAILLFLFVILFTGSRAAYFGLFIGFFYFFFLYSVNLVHPKRKTLFLLLKILAGILLIIAAYGVYYINTHPKLPDYLEKSETFQEFSNRLSIDMALDDPRFSAWKVSLEAVKAKPILGYGPENFSIAFDKYYDPSLPYITKDWGSWYDRAHNFLFDIAVTAGIPALIIYLSLIGALFWGLQKIKKKKPEQSLVCHGIQATFLAYLAANFFSFDSFGTYLIFFLLVGYSLHLISSGTADSTLDNTMKNTEVKKNPYKFILISVLFCVLVIFLWQYNFVPLKINAEINKASTLADQKYCGQALSLMDKILPEHSFLDSYARMEYVEFTKTCNDYFPENNLTYIKRGLELINEAIKIQPFYTRYWIFMGSSTTVLAAQEKDTDAKNNLLKQASYYLDRALQLAPKHQEILIEQTKMEIVAGDYKNMQNYSEKCIALNPGLGDCYWYLALSEIYLKDIDAAKKNIEIASNKRYNINSQQSLDQLSNAYGSIADYQNLIAVYEKLIVINPNVAQYHSSLAFFYKELGEYDKARQEALKVLQLSPESKQNVEEFLKTLPY